REEAGHLVARLTRRLGDFDLAEDSVQDAILAALRTWERDGIPRDPAAWLLTTAYRRALDRVRREARHRDKLALLDASTMPADTVASADDRLRLLFTCCHPALSREAQVALTLRAVAGLTTVEIARAFLVPEATMAQRIVRAKRKIVDAGIPWRVPEGDEVRARLDEVLAVLYLLFNEAHLSSGPSTASRPDLGDDAEWLTRLVVGLLPDQPEAMGLLACVVLSRARDAARFGAGGDLVLLQDQDRSRWDRERIAEGLSLLEAARRLGTPGRFWIQAAIAACHCEAAAWETTDWPQILALYGALQRIDPSPVVRLNRAVALSHVAGPAAALEEVETLGAELGRYHLWHATRAELLRQFGRDQEARAADARALELTANPAEQRLLRRRIAGD
ncbi:MAG: sigma-70 family RNA polymerase sigma factor, partial [Chloroflexi bacterium]